MWTVNDDGPHGSPGGSSGVCPPPRRDVCLSHVRRWPTDQIDRPVAFVILCDPVLVEDIVLAIKDGYGIHILIPRILRPHGRETLESIRLAEQQPNRCSNECLPKEMDLFLFVTKEKGWGYLEGLAS